jgi:hypothetical protein
MKGALAPFRLECDSARHVIVNGRPFWRALVPQPDYLLRTCLTYANPITRISERSRNSFYVWNKRSFVAQIRPAPFDW